MTQRKENRPEISTETETGLKKGYIAFIPLITPTLY